jgi:hypothetical protein
MAAKQVQLAKPWKLKALVVFVAAFGGYLAIVQASYALGIALLLGAAIYLLQWMCIDPPLVQ